MAKEVAITDERGMSAPKSYWVPVQANIGFADKTAHIVFYGYASKAAYQAGKASIGSKSYDLTGAEFAQAANALKDKSLSLLEICYAAAARLDVPDPEFVPDPAKPEVVAPMVSFFKDAKDV